MTKKILAFICSCSLALLCACGSDAGDVSSTQAAASTQAATTVSPKLSSWELILVNAQNWMPEDYQIETASIQGYKIDARICDAASEMIADAEAQGISLLVCSGYRSVDKQTQLFENKVQRVISEFGYGREKAEQVAASEVARPGTSEHNTGLAMDIVTPSYQGLNDGYANTDAAKWLKENAADYGFILRFPKEKEALTGVIFEPWHYRYVGIETAKEIMSRGICLEEYVAELKGEQAPTLQ